jgi:hypothetical protein
MHGLIQQLSTFVVRVGIEESCGGILKISSYTCYRLLSLRLLVHYGCTGTGMLHVEEGIIVITKLCVQEGYMQHRC